MERKEILITGGAGYIGSHTLVELYNSGYTPIVVDNLSNSSINNIKGVEQIIKNKIDFYQVDCTGLNIKALLYFFLIFKRLLSASRRVKKLPIHTL